MTTTDDASPDDCAAWQLADGVFARLSPSPRRATWHRVGATPTDLFGVVVPDSVTHLALISERPNDLPIVAYAISRRGEEHRAGPHPGPGSLATLACDVLRRCLQLPTAPATQPPSQWTLRAWLELLLEAAADPSAPAMTWDAAAALHPAHGGRPASPQELAFEAIAVDETVPWPLLHAGVAAGQLVVPGLTADEATWMDHPFFARWLLAGHRDVDELLDDLHLFLPPVVASAVELTASMIGRLGFERQESGIP